MFVVLNKKCIFALKKYTMDSDAHRNEVLIAEIKNRLFETAQCIGKDGLKESIKALHSVLGSTECSLWSINHNSTRNRNDDADFYSTSLIWRECNISYQFERDTDFVNYLVTCVFAKGFSNKESSKLFFTLNKEDVFNLRLRSHNFVDIAQLNSFILFPIYDQKSSSVTALLELSFHKCVIDNSFLEKLSSIIGPFFSSALIREFQYRNQTMMTDLINCHRKHKDKDISVLFDNILHGVILKTCPSQGSSIFVWDNYQNRYNLMATTGLVVNTNPTDVYYQMGEGRTGNIGKTGRPFITDDIHEEIIEDKVIGKCCERLKNVVKTEMFIPIKDPSQTNEVIGIIRLVNKINACNCTIVDYFNDNDVAIMEDAADYLALIIANVWKEESQYDFIDKLTHEIITPANAIWKTAKRLYTHLSDNDFLGRNLSPYLKNIIDFADIQRWQVSTNLFLSKNQRNQPFETRYTIKPTLLNEVIKDGIDIAIPIARKYDVHYSNIYINSDSDNKLVVNIDRNAFITVFYNLFTNAIKYHDSKAKNQFYIETSYTIEGDSLVIKVADNGIGINATEINKVFEKGYRGESAIRINASGYGIGLTVVKQIVEDFGGTISVFKNRKPTIFQIRIPIKNIQ